MDFEREFKTVKDITGTWATKHGKILKNKKFERGEEVFDTWLVVSDELRQEAIKWVKKLMKDMKLKVSDLNDNIGWDYTNLENPVFAWTTKNRKQSILDYTLESKAMISVMMAFFNITEEDLK